MGGAATNSGINYQQRVAALTLAAQYTGFDLSQTFGIGQQLVIESVHFETDDPIDDLKIICVDLYLYLQVKRSLSLQIDKGSDFYKTIEQFVVQFSKGLGDNEQYVLVTSPQSSRTITQDLTKIFESIRLNDSGFKENPLNQSEKETFDKYEKLFYELFEAANNRKATKEEFIKFTKKVYVSVIDIEQGRSDERVAVVLLKSENLIDPHLVWKMLIANCLDYGRKRQSINKKALEEILNRYKVEEQHEVTTEDDRLEELLKTEIILKGRFPVAKEVLLVESFVEEGNFLITELFRFTDDGKIKHQFSGNKIKLRGTDDEWTVIHRAATFAGIERFISENEERLAEGEIAIIPANDIDEAENTEAAELHRKYLVNLQKQNKDILRCLHCDKPLNPSKSILVEIDDLDTKPAIGAIHPKCLRVIDRVMGVTGLKAEDSKDDYLANFDYKEWARLMMKGQGMMNQLRESAALESREKIIFWSSDNKEFRDYSYCLKFSLSDGSSIHMTDRGRIHRFGKSDAIEAKDQMANTISKSQKDGNPLGYTSRNLVFGNYNQLLELKDLDETIIEIESVEIDKYSKLFEKREEHINFYAPICIVRDAEEETILSLGNAIPLISDPLAFHSIIESWKNLGFDLELDKLELKIIKSDIEFDGYMRELFADGMVPIIDPLFNKQGELVKGTKIANMQQQFASKSELSRKKISNPTWKKGDKVRLEIPTIDDGNYPEGILLEDEFQGEDGQLYALFRPVEDGNDLGDLAYAVPSKILGKVI